ncbi:MULTISPECIES: CDP-diacylglycerol--glycerol-3-phosphate 3-phosphatidyltransferase [Geobacter]|uniref:CDP-diacylglycerol--glycerol-3-phosphate 3-phosphatidyltransferase n=2 Tax=Geobacter TaxID=28231 RepID=A0A0C1U2V3_9BACT|nr:MULTISPECIES: CDP-diacylglycerol--glycerol-3-phosphate 3-phosphatidyltransferase [Geobacter]ANA40222.1 CDP-diacylglycerol--glycerol-3-phosphate 3-phosphatidyltransferase [Geobacter anodireducens]KIE42125.1 CDP-diacylglycerol--glycerol-3-phosphate 3-phosphatidyltransferase [Geobacter soli]MBE2888687.1 CDP-diacylglycerol--glycerol-3-phosphate 3-phosphatidyltransferase [Geobacter anodireducens]HMN03429.1 CDP-diacylglycerol--glycerol-3-phosphate 3-phosphatidyltransferase [Geobacter anodireducens
MAPETASPIWNLPNILTLVRIALIPVMAVLLLSPSKEAGFWAAAVFAIASVTDWLDGYLARKMEIVTVFGKFLDPIADKLMVMAALIMVLPFGRIPAWMVLVILGREIIITGLRGIASTEGIVIPASDLGKFKTIFQIVAILGILLHFDYHWFFGIDHPYLYVNMHNVGMFYLWIATIITIWSGVDYLVKFTKVIAR